MSARITGGSTAITPAALMNEKLIVKSEVNDAMMIGSVCDFGVCVNISASRNSFQLARNANRMMATSEGAASGRNTLVMVCQREQPSTRAALSSSSGSDSK